MLLFLALALMPGSFEAFFGFKAFYLGIQIQSLLLYLQFGQALRKFRHLTSVLVRRKVCKNHGLRLVFIDEGILMGSLPLPLPLLR